MNESLTDETVCPAKLWGEFENAEFFKNCDQDNGKIEAAEDDHAGNDRTKATKYSSVFDDIELEEDWLFDEKYYCASANQHPSTSSTAKETDLVTCRCVSRFLKIYQKCKGF